eukprot:TRINITY_DN11228_c0_g1_i1.p1 TRINITY_DN11228_c0_g1~~TRINITY_DN11228_c0_g1_i1.p1  ORF type:complete len:159 (-),score=27.71 TRINITY_DN11228_c0_g1_i1:67-492(-)
MNQSTGSCLCGLVKFTTQKRSNEMHACHCSRCRKWTGSPLLSTNCGNSFDIVEGSQYVKVFASSSWAERAFCSNCGSSLYYRLIEADDFTVPIGLLDNVADIKFVGQIFVEEKPEYYSFANDTHNLTGAEVFAQYAGDSTS